MSARRRRLARAAFPLAIGAAFFAGLSADHVARASRRDGGQPYRVLDVFAEALATIENAYVEPVQEKELVYGAIEGMVARLDPHSQFLRPDQFRSLQEETSGEFEGIGIELTLRDDQLTVIAPIADAPAARAGIRSGDRIASIDGVATRDMTLAEAIRRMKGPAGTKVVLELAAERGAAPRTLVVVRSLVRTQSVEWRVLDRDRGYVAVRIKTFQERTDPALGAALDAARAELRGPIRGLVLDLRDDPGGLVDQAVRVADRFLSSGVIVTTEGRGMRSVEVERARPEETEPEYPIVVLVNGGTASASEIVAGALQDHGRAFIVGTPTFGKGSVQSVIELEDGAGLKLTVARYFTPRHRSIQDLGITPDELVAAAPAGPPREPTARIDATSAVRSDVPPAADPARVSPGGDTQLDAAVEHLRATAVGNRPHASALPGTSAR